MEFYLKMEYINNLFWSYGCLSRESPQEYANDSRGLNSILILIFDIGTTTKICCINQAKSIAFLNPFSFTC